MASLLDMPDEVLDIIASYLNGASLGIFAKTHERLMASATRSTKHLRVPTATMELQKLLTYRVTDVRSLDLSNCHSKSRVIQTVIFKCRSITELNIVNCNLSFSQLMNVLKSLKQLEVLNFSFFEPRKNLIASRRKSEFYASSPTIRDIYVESTPSSSLSALTIFLNACVGLKKLHVNLIESCPSLPTSRPNSMALLEIQMWEHLKTVIASFRKSTQPFIPVLLDTLFTTRLERNDLDRWKSMNSACFIYENGNISTLLPTAIQVEGRGSCLRDAYHIQLESQLAAQMTFPWGEPRGLRVDCRTPEAALRAANFFLRPITWSSELRELDLTACHWELPGGDWSNLIESAPVLEAIAIPSCFLPPQEIAENTENTENPRQPKRQRSRYNVLSFLKAIKLKQLFITGDCPHHLDILRPLLTPHNFNGIDKLAHLEELTVQNVDASATIFGALANENVRVVRLCLNGLSNVSKLKEFIQKSVRLKYFKLEAPSLPLGSNLLWDALAQGESLEELCIASRFQERVDISVILKHIPRIVGRVNVLHVHADEAQNRNKLHNAIQGFVGDYRKRNPHRYVKFQSNYSMLSSGRSLCCISNYIAKIKPVGWSLL